MTFGPAWVRACIGNISTPFEVHEPFTTHLSASGTPLITYEYVARVFISSDYGADGYSTTTFSNRTTVTTGLIAADPFVVGWQNQDLSVFPTDYVSSLAKRYSLSWSPLTSAPATPASSSSLPPQTNTPPKGLDTGAKAGIGVGVAIGGLLLAIAIIALLLRRRRKVKPTTTPDSVPEMEDQDVALAKKKWYLRGQWRSEMAVEEQKHELGSTSVRIVPGPPVELEAAEHQPDRYESNRHQSCNAVVKWPHVPLLVRC
jgi:hypothetical protein